MPSMAPTDNGNPDAKQVVYVAGFLDAMDAAFQKFQSDTHNFLPNAVRNRVHSARTPVPLDFFRTIRYAKMLRVGWKLGIFNN